MKPRIVCLCMAVSAINACSAEENRSVEDANCTLPGAVNQYEEIRLFTRGEPFSADLSSVENWSKISIEIGDLMPNVTASPDYNETTPPMPARIGGLALYQIGGSIRIYYRESGLDHLVAPSEASMLIELEHQEGAMRVAANGVDIGRYEFALNEAEQLHVNYNGGQRIWTGLICGIAVDQALLFVPED